MRRMNSMVKSSVTTVDQYIAGASEERRQALATLRELCLDELAGYEEGIDYGMPSYSRDGTVEVSFASQKNYISLYILRTSVIKANAHLLNGLSVGKGCIRYRRVDQIEPRVVRKLLADSAADTGPVC